MPSRAAGPPEPKALILDNSLPDGSGVEMLKQIRNASNWGAVAVLDKLNGLAQAARALLEARPDPEIP
jgi:DNA-binding response OmpR family regulator